MEDFLVKTNEFLGLILPYCYSYSDEKIIIRLKMLLQTLAYLDDKVKIIDTLDKILNCCEIFCNKYKSLDKYYQIYKKIINDTKMIYSN